MSRTSPIAPEALRLPAALLIAGQLSYVALTQFHAGGDANDHHHIFAEYAHDGIWMLVHLGQLGGMALELAGLVALAFALDAGVGGARWFARFGGVMAVAALALYGVLQAIDGVALKQAVTALYHAPEAEQAARFAATEVVRWLEWGARSYQDFAMAGALILFAAALAGTVGLRRLAPLVAASGLAYFAQGWVAGTDGFTAAQSIAIVLGWVLSLGWMVWLALLATRRGGVPVAAIA